MKRTSVIVLSVVLGAAGVAGSTQVAGAKGPNDHANCNGIFSYVDASSRQRDDVSHIIKEITDESGDNPGSFHTFGGAPCAARLMRR